MNMELNYWGSYFKPKQQQIILQHNLICNEVKIVLLKTPTLLQKTESDFYLRDAIDQLGGFWMQTILLKLFW